MFDLAEKSSCSCCSLYALLSKKHAKVMENIKHVEANQDHASSGAQASDYVCWTYLTLLPLVRVRDDDHLTPVKVEITFHLVCKLRLISLCAIYVAAIELTYQ